MQFVQAMLNSLWASEPDPPLSTYPHKSVRAFRTHLDLDIPGFARHCGLNNAIVSRIEGHTGYTLDDAGQISAYGSARQIVWLKLSFAAGEACWPKHADYFRNQAELSVRRSHEPRRGVAR